MNLEQFKINVLPLREKLFNYSRKMTEETSDAEDIVQEAFLKLWRMREKLDEYHSIDALATEIVKNLCIDRWKSPVHASVGLDEIKVLSGWDNPEQTLVANDQVQLIGKIMETLPPLQQTIIRMKDIEGYESEEIAEITGCDIQAVRMNLSRARKRVREVFLQLTNERKENQNENRRFA